MTPSEINILVGLQWGSENKDALAGFLAGTSDVVARFQGRAGELFPEERRQYAAAPAPETLICRGTYVDLELMAEEIRRIETQSKQKPRLVISKACPVVFDFHRKMDNLLRAALPRDERAGQAWTGVASAACGKYMRLGIEAGDLLYPDTLREKISRALRLENGILSGVFGAAEFDPAESCKTYLALAETIKPYIGDAESVLAGAVKANLRIFFEGEGGAMQDINEISHRGAAPFPTLASALFSGTGLNQRVHARVVGAAKAYLTRTDGGRLISEEKSGVASFIRSRGGERGKTTVGWLDLPALRRALLANGADTLVMTKLDVLTGIDEVKICVGYKAGRKEGQGLDLTAGEMETAEPIYKTFAGWHRGLSADSFHSLPAEALAFMRYVEDAVRVPVLWAGVGPTRFSDINKPR